MRIRWKLLFLLLCTALTPLVVVALIDYRSTSSLGAHLGATVKQQLIEQAEHELRRLLAGHAALLDRDRRIIELIVRRQAQEAQVRLSGAGQKSGRRAYFNSDYADPGRNPSGMTIDDQYFTLDSQGGKRSIPVTYDHQVIKLAPGDDLGGRDDQIQRLGGMVDVYRELRETNPGLIIWQYTSTELGIHSCYPGHGGYPQDYDHRKRAWYVQVKKAREFVFTPPYSEVSTERVTFTAAAPVFGKDGEVIGVTAVDVLLRDILKEVRLPAGWAEGSQTLIVRMDEPRDDGGMYGPVIMAKQDYHQGMHDWRDQIELQRLDSPDQTAFTELVADLGSYRTGVRKLRMCDLSGDCHEALWAYGPMGDPKHKPPHLVLVIPNRLVVASAQHIEGQVLGVTRDMLTMLVVTISVLTAGIVLIAWLGAHTITKPVRALVEATSKIAGGALDTRVQLTTHDELQELGETFNAMVPQLEDRLHVRESLAVAMEVQQSLLPLDPPQIEGLDIAGKTIYCDETGGDYYDYLQLSEAMPGRLAVVIGDVTGHGVAAALLMATGRALWRSRMLHEGSLAEVITEVNRHLVLDRMRGRFMTMMCMVIDARERSVRWVGAGHDPVIVYDPKLDSFRDLEGTDLPLGVEPSWEYHEYSTDGLVQGQVMVAGTDGIWEARNHENVMFGKARLMEVIRAHSNETADKISSAITEAVVAFQGDCEQADDITLVVVKIDAFRALP